MRSQEEIHKNNEYMGKNLKMKKNVQLTDNSKDDFAELGGKYERQGVKALSLYFSGILVSAFVPFTIELLRKIALMFIILMEVSNGY